MTETVSEPRLHPDQVEEAVAWRHAIHRRPELAYQERETADLVAARLAQFGLAVHRGLGGTGVVGTLSRGTGRRTIAIRADMDALPIHEESGVGHASAVPGVMHACGHDGHVAIALAAARACAALPDLDGTVHFVFQPAEENEAGARRMIEDGLFRLFPCEAIYALHNWPALPVGSFAALDGPMMAAMAMFEITMTGKGCHAAMPHQGVDPLVAGGLLAPALQGIVSRNLDPQQAAVLSLTQIHAGSGWNVIPDSCVLRGTTRWFDDAVGQLLERRIGQVADGVAAAQGCAARVAFRTGFPATINDPAQAAIVRRIAAAPPLALTQADVRPSMGAEDFAFMLQEKPGCYLWLGGADEQHGAPLHSPRYDFNDALVPLGAALWVQLVADLLARP